MNKKIRNLMEKNGLSQQDMADIAGTTQSFINKMLKGYKMPSVSTLKRIADYFEVSVDELID